MIYDNEQCENNLATLIDWYHRNFAQRNEATTRLHLIDELFLRCLAWDKENITCEEEHDGQYADYTFRALRKVMIVEAKREGQYFQIPAGTNRIEYSLASLIRGNQDLRNAVEQVAQYCQLRGVPIGVVCNGHQLVAFCATRDDGIPPLEGRAVVFASLELMYEKFLDLWQFMSRPGIEGRYLLERLLGNTGLRVPVKLSKTIAGYPGQKGRNTYQTDLQVLSELVLEDIAREPELEETFLRECYCQSGALSQYALVSKSILSARYDAMFDSAHRGPSTEPAVEKDGISQEMLAQSLSRRPILLIGDVGVGKTTFIRYLTRIEAADLFADAIMIYIDLGSQAMFTYDLRQFVLHEAETQLLENYHIDIQEKGFVRSVYSSDLGRFGKGIYADLRETSPEQYRVKEIELLDAKIRDSSEHLRQSIEYIVQQRQKQVVVFIDNADQRPDNVQQAAFLIAQEMAQHWRVTVFVTLRPSTFHRSLQTGALSGYHPKAFTILPPRVDRVLASRLNFALKITGGRIALPRQQGIHLRLENIDLLIRAFQESVQRSRAILEFLDNISGGNIRIALDMVRSFFGSGHIDTRKIVDIYRRQGSYYVPLHEFIRSVMYGDSEYYDPTRSPIVNLYDVRKADPKEHFLLPIMLAMLGSTPETNKGNGFVDTATVYEHLQTLGFTPDQVDTAIIRAAQGKLLETSARQEPEASNMPPALRITTIGIYHVTKLCRLFAYIDAVLVDTPLLSQKIRELIRNVDTINERLARGELFRGYLDEQWRILGGKDTYFDWTSVSSDLHDEIEHILERIAASRSDDEWVDYAML